MGLSISLETVEMLRHTMAEMKKNYDCIHEEGIRLQNKLEESAIGLGPHVSYVQDIIKKNKGLEAEAEKDVEYLIKRMLELANQMEAYILQNEPGIRFAKVKEQPAVSKEEQVQIGLLQTKQTYQPIFLDGRECKLFDHPDLIAQRGVYSQGHNSLGIDGTCGLCSSATVMNIAGYQYNEDDVVVYAMKNKLCTESGGTSARHRKQIIEGMAKVSMTTTVGTSLQDIASLVEQGKGVILAIEASYVNPEWYGPYDPMQPSGHAVTLASVVRDAKTNEIVKYVIIDSNGRNPEEARQFVEPKVLEKAFGALGAEANITNEILH